MATTKKETVTPGYQDGYPGGQNGYAGVEVIYRDAQSEGSRHKAVPIPPCLVRKIIAGCWSVSHWSRSD